MVTVSIVSHLHGELIPPLVEQLLRFDSVQRIIVTINIPEPISLSSHPKLLVVHNSKPLGFGSNHNNAFKHCTSTYFCPLNPDITVYEDIFIPLVAELEKHSAHLAAPLILSPSGDLEDSVRFFPTPCSLLKKAVFKSKGTYVVPQSGEVFCPEWVAGMFLVFKSQSYDDIGGFDERFYLYYEDVDICARLWKNDQKVIVVPSVSAIHEAQRDSHNNFWHGRRHFVSMLRYFVKHLARLPRAEN